MTRPVSQPPHEPSARVCVVGAGVTGLTAAFELGRHGHDVLVLEAAPETGGLAGSIDVDGTPVDRFYHFICRTDADLVDLVGELGIGDRLTWRASRTAFLHDGTLYRFGSPLDLLRFRPVPLLQRVRFGLNVIRSRTRRAWRELDRVPAEEWLRRQIGGRAYEVIWDPLLRTKFGDTHGSISAAWMWHRIHRIATSRRFVWGPEELGSLEDGSATLVGALEAELSGMPNVEVRTSSRVGRIHHRDGAVVGVSVEGKSAPIPCRSVVSTIALSLLPDLVADLDRTYLRRLASIDYLGVVCCLLVLRRPLTGVFWININDPRIPFNGVIEYTNLNPLPGLGGRAVVYVPHYLKTSHPRFGLAESALRAEVVEGLRLINPGFEDSWIDRFEVSRSRHAQAICTVGFADAVPGHATPLAGLYITDSAQFYPEDRTISAAIRLGRRVAAMVHDHRA